jgi:hypothetical protein
MPHGRISAAAEGPIWQSPKTPEAELTLIGDLQRTLGSLSHPEDLE